MKKGYTLSYSKFYQILKKITGGNGHGPLVRLFQRYLQKDSVFWEYLISTDFQEKMETIEQLKIFNTRRHQGKVSYEEVIKARKIVIGDLKSGEGLVYEFVKGCSVL